MITNANFDYLGVASIIANIITVSLLNDCFFFINEMELSSKEIVTLDFLQREIWKMRISFWGRVS